jgi:hypothetical protein
MKPRDLYDQPLNSIDDEPCQENDDIVAGHPQSEEDYEEEKLTLARPEFSNSTEGEPTKLDGS